MVAANVDLTHQKLRTLENRTSMMVKAIMQVLDVLKGRIADTNQINFIIQNDANGSPEIQLTFEMGTQDTHNTSFCNNSSRYITENTSSI